MTEESRQSLPFNLEQEVANRSFRFLIADDDPDARSLVEIALTTENYVLDIYTDGEQAVNAATASLPDIAILDVQMPGYSGIEVCEKIKQLSGKTFVPVLLLTSLAEVDDKVTGLNCGADEYVTKPFSLPELEARVRALLRIKVLTDQLRQTQELLADKERQLVASQVAGTAAHELGQPLTTVLLTAQLLQTLSPNDQRFASTIKTLTEQCHRMTEILKKLGTIDASKALDYPGNLSILDIN